MDERTQTDRPRRRRRKAARPGEIIEAGLVEFAARGFAATRLEDVAARAGIAKGTIYRYFDSKETLFRQTVTSRIQPTFGDMEKAVAAHRGSAVELLEAVVGMVYERLVKSDLKVIARIVIAEGGQFPEIARVYHGEVVERGQRVLRLIIEKGVADGTFRAAPAARYPQMLMAPALMAAIWTMTFEGARPLDVDRYAAAHLDLIIAGLRAG